MTDFHRSKAQQDSTAASAAPRIALFGPVWPYRGGIAQYTTRLKRALESISDLSTISFKRQYPEWLYPGESDKEPDVENEQEPDVSYLIDALSPLSWRRAARTIIAKGCDHAILSWWTLFWAPAFAYIAWHLRRHGIRTSLLCHNLFDHDSKGIKPVISKWLLSAADGYIVHAKEQARILQALYPGKPVLQRLHPIYDHFPDASEHLPKRGKLEILFFGFIRPYKGLDILLEAMQLLADPEIHLTIAGESWGDESAISRATQLSGINVEAHLEYIDNRRAAAFFERADVVVLPYLSATGSGVVTLAYHYRKAVLASKVGGLEDAVIPGRTGWLVPPGSAQALADALADMDRHSASALKDGIEIFINENSWDAMATSILGFPDASPVAKRN